MSNIEKIRQEIERLRCESGPEHFDFYDLLDYFKEFIDALPEESQMPMPEDTVIFTKGVKEGRRLEKDDLALTWEDMAKIDAIILDVNNEFAVDYSKEIDRQKFYEEVLRRFNEIKYGHEKDTK